MLLFFISCDEKVDSSNSEPTEVNFIIDKIKERTKIEILVCAHRAYHQFVQENSMAFIEKAIAIGGQTRGNKQNLLLGLDIPLLN
ncbi:MULTISPECIES: hypothetical protein [unclassified Polaribacter]|uniref:hypothetical protein n=1 Tax=unclassified Polaribacter TaxID=196858 RepID=UPI0011BE6ED9|nr:MULTISPECIES: hypothetical protein [unclassified Polaribacter]TXD51623.1 hypothetical protein ES043_11045 [Polaribacter sp. IC063]TXD58783.1 hypothetical protein ES044_11355 [Polaribacter sp. IC066]